MTPEERDTIEFGGRALPLWVRRGEDPTPKLRNIAHAVIVNDAKRRGRHRRPKLLRRATLLGGGALLALALTACFPATDTWYDIGDPLPPVTVAPVIAASCRDITGRWPFRWYGLESHLPEGCISVGPADNTLPLLQAGPTRGSK